MVIVRALQVLECLCRRGLAGNCNGFAYDPGIPNMIDQEEDQSCIDTHAFGVAASRVEVDKSLIDVIDARDIRQCV